MRATLALSDYITGIKNTDISILSRAITLVESKKPEHTLMAEELIKAILPLTGKSKRIGISGTPGVGKSTFIENFGMYLIDKGNKLAVLTIDPTSQITGGAILGDKTRMQDLASNPNAFIRPSPSGDTLGGIAAKTRESLLLCEAFGFDYIFVETVGVGQSEVSVANIVDMFMLLMQPGSGDELQGIKRGILEVSDLVIVNKSDGDQENVSKIASHDYKKSLEILQDNKEFPTKVLRCSSLYKKGFDEIKAGIDDFFNYYSKQNLLELKRNDQMKNWMQDLLKHKFSSLMSTNVDFQTAFNLELQNIKAAKVSAIQSVNSLFDILMRKK